MALDLVSFRELAGVPVHWGSWGRTDERELARAWLPELELALETLWSSWPWGRPVGIRSGGAYVNRPPTPGDRHAVGTAFDLMGFAFGDVEEHPLGAWAVWELEDRWSSHPKEAIGIEALLRLELPQVLGPQYYESRHAKGPSRGWRHRNHFHVDDRPAALGFQTTHSSDVRWLQWVLNVVWRPGNARPLKLDGKFGPRTTRALVTALDEIGQPATVADLSVWRVFLGATWRGAFGLVEATP